MKKSKLWTSIAEALVVMMIVVTGVVWMYNILIKSQRFSRETWNRIIATQIAREWLEAMINIRDTNAILFAWDMQNCWNVRNYNNLCMWANNATYDIAHQAYYTIFKDTDNRWKLSTQIAPAIPPLWYWNAGYRSTFQILYDANNMYTQGTWTTFKPLFTRKIYTEYIDTNGGAADTTDQKLKVTSTVEWSDSSASQPQSLVLETILSNWKWY